ncbi:MAG: amidohydrolase family protein [Acidimicrobiales bacterium]
MSQLLVSGGTVVNGTGAAPMPGTSVLLDGDCIVALGSDADTQAVTSASRIDATGCTVMPGLVDAHVHCTFDDVQSNDELFFHRDQTIAALVTAQNLQKILRAGVTSIVDPDTIFSMGPSIRDAVECGVIEGPRIKAGVQALLTSVGGTAGRLIPDEGRAGYAQVVNSVDDIILWTRRHIKYGADWIKIHATGAIPGHRGELLVWSYDELRAACDTAHELATPVMAHCRSSESVRIAVEAGVDLVLHASFMDERALQAVIDAKTPICPTFTFLANMADFGNRIGASPGMEDIFRGEIAASGKMIRAAYDEGVPLICGSESGFSVTPYGHWHGREMQVLVNQLGLSPLEAITCCTKNGAWAMRMENELGTLEVGKKADLLVVDGDPLADIRILNDRRRFRHVIACGKEVDLDRPWPSHAPLPGGKVANWSSEVLTQAHAYGTD